MVHSIGSGKMAAIARVLAQESVSQTNTEDVGSNKLAAQYTLRELWEADEANLLDEDDMNVFGLKPTTDPLNLVCCNACKKPVRDSQFAAHAALCRSLSSVEEIAPKLNHGTKRKKPPRKERKKSSKVPAVQPTLAQEMKPSKTVGSHGSAPSNSRLNKKMQLTSSSPNEPKGNAPIADGLLVMNSSGINSGFVDSAAGAEEPLLKHSKLLAADSQLILDHLGTAKGVNKNLFLNTQEAITCEYRNGSKTGSGKTSEHVVGYEMPRQVHNCYSPTRGVPAPLATKIYYCQRDQRIRSAISDLYKASTDECWSDFVWLIKSTKIFIPLQISAIWKKNKFYTSYLPPWLCADTMHVALSPQPRLLVNDINLQPMKSLILAMKVPDYEE
ncbi:SCA7 domain-containing protein [Heracleum sosnowskyi]|uniref:SCA7 domain-containing protein n=1 Tax=Heracleum sosnowskyi TaxID=360622 RepID=A0AAD8J3M2_9APIA|nr:SCA7 domain-containing protein [Heracleum sosnowskyi]